MTTPATCTIGPGEQSCTSGAAEIPADNLIDVQMEATGTISNNNIHLAVFCL
jgi:hypothetical protein